MPQRSWLGPLSFIVLSAIDSHMKFLLSWTTQNSMKINYSKTPEVLLGPLSKLGIPHLVIITTQSNASASLNSLEFTLVMTCLGICMLTIKLYQSQCSLALSQTA